ncbi:MAG: trypsin-like peptidase domain-containing protein [Cellulomonas sp.]|nr:trypsin-like peptidase domain-containing protein [Cellulomonas sp.]
MSEQQPFDREPVVGPASPAGADRAAFTVGPDGTVDGPTVQLPSVAPTEPLAVIDPTEPMPPVDPTVRMPPVATTEATEQLAPPVPQALVAPIHTVPAAAHAAGSTTATGAGAPTVPSMQVTTPEGAWSPASAAQPTQPLPGGQQAAWAAPGGQPMLMSVPVQPPGGQQPPNVAVDPRRRRVRRPVVSGVAAAVLGLALIAGGIAVSGATETQTTTTSDTSVTQEQAGTPPEGFSGGSQSEGQFGGGQSGSGMPQQGGSSTEDGTSTSTQAAATAATTEQQVGVVTIVTTLGYENGQAAGTGMILTSDGTVLTNNHVIEGATSIEVTVESTGQTYTATVVGTDATHDIAVLQLENASGLTAITLDDDGGVSTGDTVTAVGNAEGTGDLVAATGDVTATDQTMTASESGTESETLEGLIEFSAAVVSGDSGGPVLDSEGEVVGITTAASSGSSTIVAYAIDITDAMEIVDQIEAGNASSDIVIGYPAFLGVQVSSELSSSQPGLGSSGSLGSSTTGATIAGVIDGTPAASAGLAAGDTITAVDGTAITTSSQLSSVLAEYSPGDSVTITWTSGTTGTSQSATVTLIEGPAA